MQWLNLYVDRRSPTHEHRRRLLRYVESRIEIIVMYVMVQNVAVITYFFFYFVFIALRSCRVNMLIARKVSTMFGSILSRLRSARASTMDLTM